MEESSTRWSVRQLVSAFPWTTDTRYLLRDATGVTEGHSPNRPKRFGIKEILTAPRSPWQNAYVERLVGSIRRDCLDHVLVFNERGLRGILKSYFDYYERGRTHLSLAKDASPYPTALAREGDEISQIGGLQHRYERPAA
jgi:transposase InsO family protein